MKTSDTFELMTKYLLLLVLMACDSLPFNHPTIGTYNGYVIERGDNHSSGRNPGVVLGDKLKFEFRILGNAIHVPGDSAIQKLYGMSDYGSSHINNSLRIGWRMRQDSSVDVFAYWHVDGKFGYKYIGRTEVETPELCELEIREDWYIFRFHDIPYRCRRGKNLEMGPKYRLFPYFEDGNGHGAPHRMTFYIYEYAP